MATPRVRYWPGRAKEDARLLAEKLPSAELKDGKFRRHTQRPVVAEFAHSDLNVQNWPITFWWLKADMDSIQSYGNGKELDVVDGKYYWLRLFVKISKKPKDTDKPRSN